jgi:hypothetical protein
MSSERGTSGLDEYRKTCSIIFGNATTSQLKYLEASIALQQTALTSCDGIVSNQLKWIENYVNKSKEKGFVVEHFLKIYTDIISMFMKLVSISYDLTTANMQSYTLIINSLNEYFFGFRQDEEKLK